MLRRIMSLSLSLSLSLLAAGALCLPGPVRGQTTTIDGLVVEPFVTDSATYGWPGQLVAYVDDDLYLDVTLATGRTVRLFRGDGDIVPLDSVFAPAYVLMTFQDCDPSCQFAGWRGQLPQMEYLRGRIDLVTRLMELYPDHPDIAELRAIDCDLRQPLDGKASPATELECIDRLLTDFPDHRRLDELEWRAERLRHRVYEFEGDVGAMRQQAEAFEAFLDAHPSSRVVDRIRARIARLYYMMQEVSGGEAKEAYRARAMQLYDVLEQSADLATRLHAVMERYNLEQGRRVYIDPNAWGI